MSYMFAGDVFGALISIGVFGGACAVILKERSLNPWWGVPLGILGPFGIIVAIGIALIPSGGRDEDDGPDGFAR